MPADREAASSVSGSGPRLNPDESPLGRLARPVGAEPAFLSPHHLLAAERIRRLAERAALQPRITMSYDANHVAGGSADGAQELSDLAASARRDLARLLSALPPDCAGIVLDACVWLKGLQVVESERGWPRRSAKLVLRIGLDEAARYLGLGPFAVGRETTRSRVWRPDGARPREFG